MGGFGLVWCDVVFYGVMYYGVVRVSGLVYYCMVGCIVKFCMVWCSVVFMLVYEDML